MKRIVITLFAAVLFVQVYAQRANQKWYKHAIGVRFETVEYAASLVYGLSYDLFLSNQTSLEFIGFTDIESGGEGTAMFKYIKNIPSIPPSVRWYAGAGPHVGNWKESGTIAGIGALLGIGYGFNNMPLNFTIDWHPTVNLLSPKDQYMFVPARLAFTARLALQ